MREINFFVNFVQKIKWPHLPLCWTQHKWWLTRKITSYWPEWNSRHLL